MSLVINKLDDIALVCNIKSGLVASEQNQITFNADVS